MKHAMWTAAALALALGLGLTACSKGGDDATRDPLEVKARQFFDLVKLGKYDDAYAMYSEQTREAFPKENFIAQAKIGILPVVNNIHINKIEKHQLTATVFTQLTGDKAHFNTLEAKKPRLDFIYQGGEWFIERPDLVAELEAKKQRDRERQARADAWADKIAWSDFKVDSRLTERGPELVFRGVMENKGAEPLETAHVMVKFFDPDGKQIYSVVFVPYYLNPRDPKRAEPIAPGGKYEFQDWILSEIPDDWSGDFKFELYDAGKMPQNR